MALPVVGSVDWKWFLIGIVFGRFVLSYLFMWFHGLTGRKAG